MAAVVAEPDTKTVRWSFPIEKRQDTAEVNPLDGTPDILIWGKATDGTLDSDMQVVDPAWSSAALKTWYDTKGNVRMQHNAGQPVGRGVELDGHYVKSLICDPKAKYFIRKGILNDYSIQIINPDIRRVGDPAFHHLDPQGKAIGGVITGRPDGSSMIGELTVCDRGANYGSSFVIAKSAADGSMVLVDELTAPEDLLAEAAAAVPAKPGRGVTITLPKNVSVTMKPSDLAKLATFKQRLVTAGATTVKSGAPATAPLVLNKAGAADVAKSDLKDSDRAAMPASSFAYVDSEGGKHLPVHDEGHVRSALGRWAQQHFDSPAAKRAAAKKIVSRARKMGIDLSDHGTVVQGAGKVAKAAAPVLNKCMTCGDSGKKDGSACPDCKPAAAEKKRKVMCGTCGAIQNVKHAHCPECGNPLHPGAMPVPRKVKKNHDFACLGCGRDLDKGEKFCPDCGKQNPGYLEVADHKIPMNADKSVKERVSKKARKAKKGKKGKPFGGQQSPPFGADADDAKKDDAAKSAAVSKGKKKGGKGRSPAAGVKGQATTGLPPHREPDGAPVEQFENDAMLQDGDQEMKTAMRHKTSGVEPQLAVLHDLCCPAFSPAAVAKALPHASLASLDTNWWTNKALEVATNADFAVAQREYAVYQGLNKAAVTLKTASPEIVHAAAEADYQAFLAANRDLIKTFTDATPGPGAAPTPGHVMPGSFRRPYLSAGHAAMSPQAEGARTFPVITDHPEAGDFQRGYLSAGHASQSPANSGSGSPVPEGTAGAPQSRAGAAQSFGEGSYQAARNAMHDHLSRIAPGMCPMSPAVGDGQKPAPQVPAAAGAPEPHAAGKAAKPKPTRADKAAAAAKRAARTAKARARKAQKAARKQRALLKAAAAAPTDQSPLAAAMAPAQTVTPAAPELTAEALTEAVKAAVAPLVKARKAQDRAIRKQRKLIDKLGDQPDTTGAPYRHAGGVMNKQTSTAPAGPRTVAEAAELAQATNLRMLADQWRQDPNPQVRENAWREISKQLGTNSMTHTPDTTHPFRT